MILALVFEILVLFAWVIQHTSTHSRFGVFLHRQTVYLNEIVKNIIASHKINLANLNKNYASEC